MRGFLLGAGQGLDFALSLPLTPALSRGRGSRTGAVQNLSSTRYLKSGVPCPDTSVSPSPKEKGSRSSRCSEPEFDSISQVGVPRPDTSVSPLSQWVREQIFTLFRTRIRLDISGRRTSSRHLGQSPLPMGKGADLHAVQNLSSTRYLRSVQLIQTPRSVPSPLGEG
jgi:hypothetical protein